VTFLSGFISVPGPCLLLENYRLGCKALRVPTYMPVFRRKMSRSVQGRWGSADSSTTFIGRTCLPAYTTSHPRKPVLSTFTTMRISFIWRSLKNSWQERQLSLCKFGSLTLFCGFGHCKACSFPTCHAYFKTLPASVLRCTLHPSNSNVWSGRELPCHCLLMNGTGLQGA